MATTPPIFESRAEYSQIRLKELGKRIGTLPAADRATGLTIFAAGSYGRLEASEFSDIDLFFVYEGHRSDHDEPRTSELRLFGSLIELVEQMDFPKLSNDAEWLKTLSLNDMRMHLGSPRDDHENLFTARMLMLLESRCLFRSEVYDGILRSLISSYYRDFPEHQATFAPWFLLNDIGRFWKTLLLNYEFKRNPDRADVDGIKQKIRNFKLKYSRMTICFATIAAIGAHNPPLGEEELFAVIERTPRERLEAVSEWRPDVSDAVAVVLEDYGWFLEQTALSEEALYDLFATDKDIRAQMFARANTYGDKMYDLLEAIDRGADGGRTRFLRSLVI